MLADGGDLDGDGYGTLDFYIFQCEIGLGMSVYSTDCDDTNAARHPGVDEHCDAVDEDCDGEIDDDPVDGSTWYTDADGDTFGDPDAPVNACHRENTTTSNADDCNDGNLHVYPGAEEHCDDEDEDCDGTVDDEAEEAAAFHADADGDGHGDPDVTSVSCNAPAGYVYDDSDCDDADPTIQDDRDGDGIADCPDLDGDGLANDAEVDGVVTGFVTDPGDPDTDGDGTDDGSDPAPLHASCATAILAWEDFDADPVDWTVISGTWTWDGSAWDTTADPAAAWLGEETWTDLTFEAAVRVDAGGEAGVIVRTSDGIDGWYVSLDEADDLVRVVNTTELGSASATVDPSTWYTLRVEVLGADADIYLDDAWLLTVTDTATTGSLGVWSTGAASSFDELFACE